MSAIRPGPVTAAGRSKLCHYGSGCIAVGTADWQWRVTTTARLTSISGSLPGWGHTRKPVFRAVCCMRSAVIETFEYVKKGSQCVETILQRLTDLDNIYDAILVGKDGLIVAGILHSEDEEVIGAMSAAAFGSITSYTTQVHSGETRHVIIETKNGTIQMQEAGDLILVVTTQGTGNLGRVRLEMKKACQQLEQLVATY